MSKVVMMISVLLSMSIALPSTICWAEIQKDSNAYFGKLPAIYQKYIQEMSELHAEYKKAKKAKDKDEKAKIKVKRNAKREELKEAIATFDQVTPLKGEKLPFKVSGNLPFVVQSVTITNVDYNTVNFLIQVKINQDIKDAKGELSQRINVYFIAVDAKDKVIPGTNNWACNHGWIKLTSGTIYEAQGHWNSNRVQNMGDFSFLSIMSKADYEKIK
jgi:hypothetical protein